MPYSNSSNTALTFSNIPPITTFHEDVVDEYNGSEYISAGFSPVSLDFNPIRVDNNLEIVRNDVHFKTLLNNILIDIGVINAC